MKFETIKHVNVNPDGTFIGKGGAVVTDGLVRMSEPNGRCPQQGCNCSNGHWLLIMKPRTTEHGHGIVEGIKVTFDDRQEMEQYLSNK